MIAAHVVIAKITVIVAVVIVIVNVIAIVVEVVVIAALLAIVATVVIAVKFMIVDGNTNTEILSSKFLSPSFICSCDAEPKQNT